MSERFEHTMSEALTINNVDPDDGNDWKCNACGLPIFSTPFIDNPNGHTQGRTRPLRSAPGHMHEQCANKIPAKLEKHPLHPMAELTLQHVQPDDDDNNTHDYYCSRCGSQCGSKFYKCGGRLCGFTLDLLCALAIKIVHQSHKHELTATMGSSCSFICSACGTQHDPPERGEWGLSYVCGLCDFWIHPDCAVLPNAIIEFDDDKAVVHHEHPLLLSYGNSADELWRFLRISIWGMKRSDYKCAICGGGGDDYKGLGWYRCFHCDYSVHIKCVVYSHPPQRFKPVLLRDAKFPGLIHLPMANEHQSVVQLIMNSTAGTIDCASTSSYNSKVHQHPLVINNNNNDDDDDRVCNACVQLISPSDAFYSCNVDNNSCRDFFVHSCCAQLPDEITTRRCSRNPEDHHTLPLLVQAVGKFPFLRSVMGGKHIHERRLHNGFAYSCKECNVYIDVINALMPASITHDAHAKSHILCITYQDRPDLICSCCKRITSRIQIGYECNNCNDFYIHMDCALLPNKVSHEFDRHPLQLITTSNSLRDHHQQGEEEQVPLCEICEQDMDDSTGRWFYGCKECDQSFHIDCIPYFDDLSGIKFGFTIRVKGHSCPLACVRALSVEGYKCAHCHVVIRESDNEIAFECELCDYRIDECCAHELLLKG